jgi:hypothetical protein
MSYHDLSECTLSQDERVAEKDRIITMLADMQDELTPKEREFITKMESYSWVSVKQLFWLRDIKDKYL